MQLFKHQSNRTEITGILIETSMHIQLPVCWKFNLSVVLTAFDMVEQSNQKLERLVIKKCT